MPTRSKNFETYLATAEGVLPRPRIIYTGGHITNRASVEDGSKTTAMCGAGHTVWYVAFLGVAA